MLIVLRPGTERRPRRGESSELEAERSSNTGPSCSKELLDRVAMECFVRVATCLHKYTRSVDVVERMGIDHTRIEAMEALRVR